MPEKIIDIECLDVYRIKNGVLVNVVKYKTISRVYGGFNKRKHKKVADNIYKTKEEISLKAYGSENIIPIGSYVIGDIWIEPITDYKKFRFEIKTTGDSLSGDIGEINKYLYSIDNILASYVV